MSGKVYVPGRAEDDPNPIVDCSHDEVLTQQSAAADCDMNEIMRRALAGAIPSHVNPVAPVYGSLIGMGDLRDAMNLVRAAEEAFLKVDPFVRKRFHNDPAELLDFVGNDQNREEATKLGLLKPIVAPVKDEHLEELRGLRADIKANSGAKRKSRDDE